MDDGPGADRAARVQGAGHEPMKILLATDRADRARALSGLIGALGLGMPALTARGDAAGAIEAGAFDLVFFEVGIEGAGDDDTAFAEAVRRSRALGIPVVAWSPAAAEGLGASPVVEGVAGRLEGPGDPEMVRSLLDRIGAGRHGPSDPGDAPIGREPALDRSEALAILGGDEALLDEVIGIFLDDWPRVSAELDAAVAVGDPAILRRLGHGAAGAAVSLGAHGVVSAARRLEAIGRSGHLDGVAPARLRLEREVDRLRSVVGRQAPSAPIA